MADADLGPYGKSRGTRWGRVFAWLLFVAVATFVAAFYLPLYRAHQKLADQYHELGQRSQALSETVSQVQGELKTVTTARDQLQTEHDQNARGNKTSDEQREHLRTALTPKLDKYSKKYSVASQVIGGALLLAFDSNQLFLPLKVELTPAGRALLCDVAKNNDAKTLSVRASLAAGSNVPPALAGSYPSAWALSAARAATVAQALQGCGVPATQLSAIGNGSEQLAPGLQLTGDPVALEFGFVTR